MRKPVNPKIEIDDLTGIGRIDSYHVGNVPNRDIARCRLIIGRGNVILKDALQRRRVGLECTPTILREYQALAP